MVNVVAMLRFLVLFELIRIVCHGQQELGMKVHSLTLANESLHSMLNAAEREVRHRTLQIECLSEENDELRHRCGQLELFLHGRRSGE